MRSFAAILDFAALSNDARLRIILLLSMAAVTLGVLLWAVFLRKARKRRKRINRPHNWELPADKRSDHHRHHHRRQRKRAAELPINPTLAESGGLPPVRPADQPNPPDSTG